MMMRKMQNSLSQSHPDVKTAVVQIKRLVVGTKAVFAHTQLGRSWTMHCIDFYRHKDLSTKYYITPVDDMFTAEFSEPSAKTNGSISMPRICSKV